MNAPLSALVCAASLAHRPLSPRIAAMADEIAANLRAMGAKSTSEVISSPPARIGGLVAAQHALTLQRVWWSR